MLSCRADRTRPTPQSRTQRTTNTSSSSACQPVVTSSSLRILPFPRSPWSLPAVGPDVLEGAPPALRRRYGSTVGSGAAGPFTDGERPSEMPSAGAHVWASAAESGPPGVASGPHGLAAGNHVQTQAWVCNVAGGPFGHAPSQAAEPTHAVRPLAHHSPATEAPRLLSSLTCLRQATTLAATQANPERGTPY